MIRSPLDGLRSPFGDVFGRTAGGGGTGGGETITLAPLAATQYSNIVPVDFSASVPSGSRAYSLELPEGLEVMTKALRVIGSPVATQSETTAQIVIVPPSGPLQYVEIPITVSVAGGAVRTVSTAAELYALAEFGTSYVGPGCIVELAAGATINLLTPTNHSNNGRFAGLSSPIIIKSVDVNNKATITGKAFTFAATGLTVGNVSFVDVVFDIAQTGSAVTPGGTLTTQTMLGTGGTANIVNVAAIRCEFVSDVAAGSTKTAPKGEMSAVVFGRPTDRLAVWDCTFRNLFNGALGCATNMLFGRNSQTECWGDLFRASPDSTSKTSRYVMSCDNFISQSVSDGLLRHADGLQMGGTAAGSTILDFEQRGDIAADGFLAELPAIAPGFWNANLVRASTNQTAGATNDVLIRMETDVAAGNLTVQLPSIASVANGWEVCIQKYSGDTTHTVTVLRNGSDTINGVGVNYPILGAWKAVRFHKNGAAVTNWSIQVYGPGIQPGLYQDDGGLVSLTRGHIWACGATTAQFAGRSFEVLTDDVTVENNTLVKAVYGDVDGDGTVDTNDYAPTVPAYPAIQLRNLSALAELTVINSVAASIAGDAGFAGTLTQANNDVGQVAGDAAVAARFVGAGARSATRLDAINAMRHVQGGPLAGTSIGAVWLGLADGPYDWINMRPRIPGAPNVVTRPVISLGSGVIQIATAPVFSPTGTPTYQWYLNGAAISGATSATLSTTGLASGDLTLRCTLASDLGDCIVDSLPLAYVAPPPGATFLGAAGSSANPGVARTFAMPAPVASGNTIVVAVLHAGTSTFTSLTVNGLTPIERGTVSTRGTVNMRLFDVVINTAEAFNVVLTTGTAFQMGAVAVWDVGTRTFQSRQTYANNNPTATNSIAVTSSEAAGRSVVAAAASSSNVGTYTAGTNLDTTDYSAALNVSFSLGAAHEDSIVGGAGVTYAMSFSNDFVDTVGVFGFYA
jgi:hypothetical protein